MALKATIFKADLQVSDLDRHYYQEHSLTLARHPSETDERLMVRLLAFALHASETLAFGRGISTEDEATLWDIDPTGNIDLWIDVGLPDERDIRRACHRSNRMVLITYGGRAADVWWQQNRDKLSGFGNLTVLNLSAADSQALAALAGRTMKLQCTIQEGNVWIGDDTRNLEIAPQRLQG
ncbi:MAG TPA: YaeQ family protein [Rhodocyclaceae bacterium]|nr:YaeQ family protein [Rhodocyclaceae bacterium]